MASACSNEGSWGQHGAHLGLIGPRWAPCWTHEPCYYIISYTHLFLTLRLASVTPRDDHHWGQMWLTGNSWILWLVVGKTHMLWRKQHFLKKDYEWKSHNWNYKHLISGRFSILPFEACLSDLTRDGQKLWTCIPMDGQTRWALHV